MPTPLEAQPQEHAQEEGGGAGEGAAVLPLHKQGEAARGGRRERGRGGGRGGHLELARANPGVSVGADGGLPVRELRRARAAATELLGRQAPRLRGLQTSW